MLTNRSYIVTRRYDMLIERTDIFTDMLMFTDKYDIFNDRCYIFTHRSEMLTDGSFLFTDRSDILYSVICYFSLMLKDKF